MLKLGSSVKMLVVSDSGQEGIATKENLTEFIVNQKSTHMRFRLKTLSEALTRKGIEYQIEFLAHPPSVLAVSSKINDGNYDLVVFTEDIKLSAWEILRLCTDFKSDTKRPRFYLDGSIENIIDSAIKASSFSGAVGINKNGMPLSRGAYRKASRSVNHPINNQLDTKFVISSVTKLFTSVAIAKLAEEKKLNFNDPISQYLPDSFSNREFFGDQKVTIRELLTHTSGLCQAQVEPFFKASMLDFKSLTDFIPVLMGDDIYNSKSRGDFEYSNLNYFLLGIIVEQVTGIDYYKYIQDNIFPKTADHNLPMRGYDQSFALNYRPTLELIPVPTWLPEMIIEENATLSKAAKSESHCLNLITETINRLDFLYQNDLAKIKDSASFSLLKSKFKVELEKAFKDLDKIRSEIHIRMVELDKELEREDVSPAIKNKGAQLKKLLSETSLILDEKNFFGVQNYLYTFVNDLSLANPAGYWRSTVDDLLIFQEALWSGKIIKNPNLLLDDKIFLPPGGKFQAYSYGVCTWGEGIAQSIGHDGAGYGAISSARRYPEVGMTAVTLANDEVEDSFTLIDSIGQYLVASCSPKSDIQYFDPRMNPNTMDLFIQDAVTAAHNKPGVKKIVKQYQSYIDQSKLETKEANKSNHSNAKATKKKPG